MNDAGGDERAAQLEKAVLRSLEWLEAGDAEAARDELLRVAPGIRPEPLADPAVTDQELEAAFASAEPEVEQMLDADGVAQAAIAEADQALATPPLDPRAHEVGGHFATATMAELLELQGDADGASRIRAALVVESGSTPENEPEPAAGKGREHVIATLERWLTNLRGGARA